MIDWITKTFRDIKGFFNSFIKEISLSLKENRVLLILFIIIAVFMAIVILRWFIGALISFFKNCKIFFKQSPFQRLHSKYMKVKAKTNIVLKRYLPFQIILVLSIVCFLIGWEAISCSWEGVPKKYFLIAGAILLLIGVIGFCVLYVKRADLVDCAGYVYGEIEAPEENWVTETTTTYESWDGGTWRETGKETNTYNANEGEGIFVDILNLLIVIYNCGLFLFSVAWYIVLSFFTTLYVVLNLPFNPLRKKRLAKIYKKQLGKSIENKQ